ncbi:unnamed protein product [Effrenium voratum]|nr:unnamed protein product [Effrenium voratum]
MIAAELLAAGRQCREPRLAREIFEAALGLAEGPQRLELLMRIGDTYLEDALTETALEWFEKAQGEMDEDLKLAVPQRAALMARRALAARGPTLQSGLDQCEAAMNLLRGAGELDSEVGLFVRRVLGDLLVRLGRSQEALLELQALPKEPLALVSLGMAYLAAEDFLRARDAFEEALPELEEAEALETPLAAQLLRGLGLALSGAGDAAAALDPLQAARTILEWRGRMGTEEGSQCLLALGDVYADLDDFEEALRCFELVCLNAEVGSADSEVCIDVDDLFVKIEEARRQLRHSDAARLFGEEEDGTASEILNN